MLPLRLLRPTKKPIRKKLRQANNITTRRIPFRAASTRKNAIRAYFKLKLSKNDHHPGP
jgi:hypothetical protein